MRIKSLMVVSGAVLSVTLLCGTSAANAANAASTAPQPAGTASPADPAPPAADPAPQAAPGGVTGIDGSSQWILYEDGTLEFGPGTLSPEGSFAHWRFLSQSVSKIVFLDPAATSFPTNSSGLFRDLPNLRTVENAGQLNTSNVTDFARFMQGNEALESIDVSGWDTSKVQNFEGMFFGASSLSVLDPSKWNTGSSKRFDGMFADAASLTALDLSAWDTSHATGFVAVFQGMTSLSDLNVSTWDTSAGTDFAATFVGVSALESLDISQWQISGSARTIDMLNGTTALTQLTIGAGSALADDAALGEAPGHAPYTCKWVLVAGGTAEAPQGPWTGTAAELLTHSRGGTAAGSYVFQQQLNVSFDGNGSGVTGTVAAIAGATGETLALPASGFERPGYTFVAWNTAADGSGASYAAESDVYLANGVDTLFAQWKKNDDGTVIPPVKPPVTGGNLANTGSETGPFAGLAFGTALALLGAGTVAVARRSLRG